MTGPDKRSYRSYTSVRNYADKAPNLIHIIKDIDHPAVRIQLVSTWDYKGLIPSYTAIIGKRTVDVVPFEIDDIERHV